MEVAKVDRDIDIVDRLRLGGPNAMEVVDQAADEIARLRGVVMECAALVEGHEQLGEERLVIAEQIRLRTQP
jgi:hypothetical protein